MSSEGKRVSVKKSQRLLYWVPHHFTVLQSKGENGLRNVTEDWRFNLSNPEHTERKR